MSWNWHSIIDQLVVPPPPEPTPAPAKAADKPQQSYHEYNPLSSAPPVYAKPAETAAPSPTPLPTDGFLAKLRGNISTYGAEAIKLEATLSSLTAIPDLATT